MADKFQLKALITGVDELSPTLKGIRKNIAGFRKQLQSSGLGDISFGDIAQGGALAAPFIAGVQAAIGFESAMADVKKVVDFETPAQFQAMSDDILEMSTRLPMAAEGIAAIVASGGQSGIAREELGRFAEDAVKMGIAFDQTAEQSGDMMAKWRTSFRLGQDEVVALADKVNYLSNTGAANAQQIASIVTAIGPLGEVAGVASGEIAAMGATMAGVGVAQDVAATGVKNFMLALTAGASATKAQQDTLKALRLDSAEVAKGMQTDAQGTMTKVLKAISMVDKDKQAAVLTQLFGKESIGAIAPLLTNLETLQKNFAAVGDETAYAGSMNKEYASRAATTANNLQLLKNQATALGIAVGNTLLPPFNSFLDTAGPLIGKVSELVQANPWLIKGIVGAAAAFLGLKLAVMVTTTALALMSAVAGTSPIGLIVRGIALAAGFLIANWSAVVPFFSQLWSGISEGAGQMWGEVMDWFQLMENRITYWVITAVGLLQSVFNWSPLGLLVSNWEPIVGFFKGLWERVAPYMQPLIDGAKWLFSGEESASAAAPPAMAPGLPAQHPMLGSPQNPLTPGALMQPAAKPAQLEGAMVVRFEGAPPGMRVAPAQTNQPGLTVTPQVGYRSLSAGG